MKVYKSTQGLIFDTENPNTIQFSPMADPDEHGFVRLEDFTIERQIDFLTRQFPPIRRVREFKHPILVGFGSEFFWVKP